MENLQAPSSDPNREEGPQPSPSDPHLGGRTLCQFQANLGDLGKAELRQLMEDLCQEVALRELNVPPRNPPLTPWGNPVGNRDPNVDDQEVTFLRWGRWEPRGQPLWPPAPTQPDEDVGHLINTLATGLWLGTPCSNTFSGKAILGKTEVSFEQWYHEVQCMKDHYPQSMVQESIVWSIKGAAADTARYLGPTTNMAHILQKLMVISSTVASFNILMQIFYKVTQGNQMKVSSFTMRLEGTLNQIKFQCHRGITDQEVQQHLKDCLFHGVHKHIRDSIRYLYSNLGTTYS